MIKNEIFDLFFIYFLCNNFKIDVIAFNKVGFYNKTIFLLYIINNHIKTLI
jgi:hypothetical protein